MNLSGIAIPPEPHPSARTAAGEDFGKVVRRPPRFVVEPRRIDELLGVVRQARAHGLNVAARGEGHSTNGHAQAKDGIVVALRSMDSIHMVGPDQARVDAGATWRQVLRRTLAVGLTPPVLTDYLGLSIGGTLSVGGLSGSSFRHGAQVDHVTELEVVTGSGMREVCSPTRSPELFEAALAGQGQCGIIARATIRLARAPACVRVFRLPYPDLATMLSDEVLLVEEERFDHILGVVAPESRKGWSCSIEAAKYYEAREAAVSDTALTSGLRCNLGAIRTEDRSYLGWADRVSERVELLESMGVWHLPHPWLDLFVPASAVGQLLETLLAQPMEDDVGPLRVLLNPLRPARLSAPLLRVPPGDVVFLCDVLRTARPEERAIQRMLDWNRELFELNRRLGGRHYSISTVELSQSDWIKHFGERWEWLAAAKCRFDPDHVLTPGPGIF
jgi:cytokinin dehydrogenase